MRRLLSLLLIVGAGCLRVAEHRALRDETIGTATSNGLSVSVRDGLARVLTIEEAAITLWAGAPNLEIRLISRDGGAISVEAHNLLRDAELTTSAPAVPFESPIPTRKLWQVELEAGVETVLSIGAPDRLHGGPWRFLLLADVQRAIDEVQDIYKVMNRDTGARFLIFSGDLTSQGSADELIRFKQEAEQLRIPIFATLGNHELGTRDDLFHDHFGRGNFSFVFRDVRFTLLDSASATLDPIVHEWLDGWLALGSDQFHIVTMHIPPLDPAGARNGAFASRAEGARLVRRLADHAVDLTVYGHIHSYYAFENAGIPAFITGGGGAIPERFDGIRRHYLAVDVNPRTNRFETSLVRIDD